MLIGTALPMYVLRARKLAHSSAFVCPAPFLLFLLGRTKTDESAHRDVCPRVNKVTPLAILGRIKADKCACVRIRIRPHSRLSAY